jgi:hypothetical protein
MMARKKKNALIVQLNSKAVISTETMESIGKLIMKELKDIGKGPQKILALNSSQVLMLFLKKKLKLLEISSRPKRVN